MILKVGFGRNVFMVKKSNKLNFDGEIAKHDMSVCHSH